MTPEQMNKIKPGSVMYDPETGEAIVEGIHYKRITFTEALKAMAEGKIIRSEGLSDLFRLKILSEKESNKLQFQSKSHEDWAWIRIAQFFERDLTRQWYIMSKDNQEQS